MAPARLAGRRPVLFAHVHKSGGSTVCHWAKVVGERLDPKGIFCTIGGLRDFETPADYDHSPGPGRRWLSCHTRSEIFRLGGLSWASLEHELCHGDLCFEDFVYGTVLRDTIDRIVSQINYEGPEDVDSAIQCLERSRPGDCPVDVQAKRNRTWVFLDNYLVRTFGGCAAANAPPGGLSRGHLEAAVRVLERFDFVIPLANLSSPRARAAMDRALGWHVPYDSERFCWSIRSVALTPGQEERLRRLNALDEELTARFFADWAHGR